ncbi:MAG: hypothetical protein U0931_41235 [Vulcanimicrobiota bacterium]
MKDQDYTTLDYEVFYDTIKKGVGARLKPRNHLLCSVNLKADLVIRSAQKGQWTINEKRPLTGEMKHIKITSSGGNDFGYEGADFSATPGPNPWTKISPVKVNATTVEATLTVTAPEFHYNDPISKASMTFGKQSHGMEATLNLQREGKYKRNIDQTATCPFKREW